MGRGIKEVKKSFKVFCNKQIVKYILGVKPFNKG
jgi:hypothetical protein